jgi:phosphoribosylamine--glycine ligase
LKDVFEQILRPTVAGLCEERIDYRGCLYAQFIATEQGPKMVEYNVRFGDPETQVVLPRLESDLAQLLAECAAGALTSRPGFVDDAAVTVVVASDGYPNAPRSGDEIHGLEDAAAQPGITVFHAGTGRDGTGRLVTAGGRILDVTATAPTLREARDRAYDAITRIRFDGMQYRTDIGASALDAGGVTRDTEGAK